MSTEAPEPNKRSNLLAKTMVNYGLNRDIFLPRLNSIPGIVNM